MTKKVYIICGGTVVHVAPHLALSAQAKGSVGVKIFDRLNFHKEIVGPNKGVEFVLVPTTMAFYECRNAINQDYWDLLKAAGLKKLETYKHVWKLVEYIKNQEDTKGIILPAAICDYQPRVVKKIDMNNRKTLTDLVISDPGKKADRLKTSEGNMSIEITPTEKIVKSIRKGLPAVKVNKDKRKVRKAIKGRKDIFLVSFKTLAGDSVEQNYKVGLKSLKDNGSNLVFINDIKNKYNMIMTPEEYVYSYTDRNNAVDELCSMIWDRIDLTYHRTFVKGRDRADLEELSKKGSIPMNFVQVLKHLFSSKAYKTVEVIDPTKKGSKKFKQISVGHFGCKVEGEEDFYRISSVRSSNHNEALYKCLIKIVSEEDNLITVTGGKASVGEHTQRAIYDKLGNKADSIVHFHCPMKEGSKVNIAPQKPFQCGTDECALNTKDGMEEVSPGIYAVHLEGHGPNIAFSKDVPTQELIEFIDSNWDLSKKEDGLDYAKELLEGN